MSSRVTIGPSVCPCVAQDVTAIEKRLYQGRPSGIQIDYTQNGASLSDLYVRFPFRDDALRHMLALWNRGERRQPMSTPAKHASGN